MPRFDLNLLSALDALLSERNVTRAAERLHVTQPTMSGMLQRLRYQFSDQLLVRTGRTMELTDVGISLIEPVKDALRGVDALVRAELFFDPATSTRTFSIMASDYCTVIFMPRIIAHLSKIAPGIRIEIQPINSPIERMLSGDLDLCISTNDRSLLSKERGEDLLQSRPLFSDDFVCIVADNHPIRNPITMTEYLSYPHIGIQMPGILDTLESASLRRHAPDYKATYLVADFFMIPSIVAESNVIGVVQNRLATLAARTFPIRTFLPPFEIPEINETLWWHPRLSEEPSHAWLRGMLINEARIWLQDNSLWSVPAAPRAGINGDHLPHLVR